MSRVTFITSESVTEGHPDKICDRVSDAVLDVLLDQDPDSRVAVECLVTTGTVIVAGEVSTNGYADVAANRPRYVGRDRLHESRIWHRPRGCRCPGQHS